MFYQTNVILSVMHRASAWAAMFAGIVLAVGVSGCKKTSETKGESKAVSTSAAEISKPAPQPTLHPMRALRSDWPAFHNGGALRGEGAPVGSPPMRVRWTFHAGQDEAPATQPATQPSTVPGH